MRTTIMPPMTSKEREFTAKHTATLKRKTKFIAIFERKGKIWVVPNVCPLSKSKKHIAVWVSEKHTYQIKFDDETPFTESKFTVPGQQAEMAGPVTDEAVKGKHYKYSVTSDSGLVLDPEVAVDE